MGCWKSRPRLGLELRRRRCCAPLRPDSPRWLSRPPPRTEKGGDLIAKPPPNWAGRESGPGRAGPDTWKSRSGFPARPSPLHKPRFAQAGPQHRLQLAQPLLRQQNRNHFQSALQQPPHDLLPFCDKDALPPMLHLLAHGAVGRQLREIERVDLVNAIQAKYSVIGIQYWATRIWWSQNTVY
jgi:hypothetical protein